MGVDVNSLGIIVFCSVCLLALMVDESKDVLLEVVSKLFVDCIENMAVVFDVDASAFGVTEADFTESPVVIVPSEEMLKKVFKVLVSVSNVVVGGKSEFPSDVVGENFAVDNSS